MKKATNHYLLTISYHGFRLFGWQKQPGFPSIQGELEKAMKTVCPECQPWTLSAGRTDSGVSALNLVVQIQIPADYPSNIYLKELNTHLPIEIRAKELRNLPENLQIIKDIKSKEYLYFFSNSQTISSPFLSHLIVNFEDQLDFDEMKKCTKILRGTHDFKNFKAKGVDNTSTVRTIFECEIMNGNDWISGKLFNQEIYSLKISGDGFLKQMVRIIMGTLINVGKGKTTLHQVEEALKGKEDLKVGFIAPPAGLYANETTF